MAEDILFTLIGLAFVGFGVMAVRRGKIAGLTVPRRFDQPAAFWLIVAIFFLVGAANLVDRLPSLFGYGKII